MVVVLSCLFAFPVGLVPRPVQGGPRHPPALVLHHHVQRGEALHEEQAAGAGTSAQMLLSAHSETTFSRVIFHHFSQVFIHGDELDGYMKEFDADILPLNFDGKAPVSDCRAIATKLFGSEDTAL